MNRIKSLRIIFILILLCILSALFACGDAGDNDDDSGGGSGDDDDDDTTPEDDDDDDDDDDASLPEWLRDRGYLQNRSLWSQKVDMTDPPNPRVLGVIGVGNGRVYGNLGNQFPMASWHNIGGPTYQKDLKWFSDKKPLMVAGGSVQKPLTQSISRVRNSPIVIVEAENEAVEWTSVNFAPVYPDDQRVEQAMISVWIIRNIGPAPIEDASIKIRSMLGSFSQSAFTEIDWGGRKLTIRPIDRNAAPCEKEREFLIPVGDLPVGDEKTFALALVFTEQDDDPTQIFSALENAGIDAMLESTAHWWDDWASKIVEVVTPEEKFNDLLRGLAVAIKINQAVSGGVSEMNQYSFTWLRDIHGPSLYYPLIGLMDDYKRMMDYLWGAILVKGDIANALELDMDISSPPPQPDWESLSEMTGRTRAEGPSLLVLEYENYYKSTGDLAPIVQRWGLLKRAVLAQQYVDGCLLHFSSDETFEDLMEAAFGESFITEPDESTLSFYSSLLAMRAAGFMAHAAQLLDYDDDAATFSALEIAVKNCLEETFWLENEGFYAVKVQTDTREPHLQLFEDVSTMPLWLDALPVDDPKTISHFEATMDQLGHPDGLLYSPIVPPYSFLTPGIEKGVLTGMSHGYWLSNLDKLFHPMADTAFALWTDVFTRTGFTDEAVIVDDFSHLSLLREPLGFVCDISSRFRSWESGVMGFAFLYHLTGYDVSVPEQWVRLAPHLPPDWEEMAFRGLAYGDGRIDLEIATLNENGRSIKITTDQNASFDLLLTVPLDGEPAEVKINGDVLPPTQYESLQNSYGRFVLSLAPIAVEANDSVEISIDVP